MFIFILNSTANILRFTVAVKAGEMLYGGNVLLKGLLNDIVPMPVGVVTSKDRRNVSLAFPVFCLRRKYHYRYLSWNEFI